jgi:hypothetical protein
VERLKEDLWTMIMTSAASEGRKAAAQATESLDVLKKELGAAIASGRLDAERMSSSAEARITESLNSFIAKTDAVFASLEAKTSQNDARQEKMMEIVTEVDSAVKRWSSDSSAGMERLAAEVANRAESIVQKAELAAASQATAMDNRLKEVVGEIRQSVDDVARSLEKRSTDVEATDRAVNDAAVSRLLEAVERTLLPKVREAIDESVLHHNRVQIESLRAAFSSSSVHAPVAMGQENTSRKHVALILLQALLTVLATGVAMLMGARIGLAAYILASMEELEEPVRDEPAPDRTENGAVLAGPASNRAPRRMADTAECR